MPDTLTLPTPAPLATVPSTNPKPRCRVAVIWIDWYPYHVARFSGLRNDPRIGNSVVGIELVGGIGVHAGLKFREDLPAGLPVETLMPTSSWKDASKGRLALALWRHLSRLNPDVVLVPGYYTLPAVAAALWARLHDRKSVLMTESTRADHQRVWWKEASKSLLIRTLFGWAVSGGEAHREYLADLGFPSDRVGRFYDVVDNTFYAEQTRAFRKGRPEVYGLPSSPYILYVGRLAAEKNVDSLLDAYLAYRETGGLWPLVLVGDGPEAAALRARAASSPFADQILFPGLKTSSELPLFYAFAGCFVLPSTREPWGLVVNEAMASGLPVIVSSRCGCVPDLVSEGRNGFIFDPGTPGDLTRCLLELSACSPAQIAAMSAEATSKIASYSPAAFAQEIVSIAES